MKNLVFLLLIGLSPTFSQVSYAECPKKCECECEVAGERDRTVVRFTIGDGALCESDEGTSCLNFTGTKRDCKEISESCEGDAADSSASGQ